MKEVTTQVSEAAADAGIIYATDAYSAGLPVVAQADDTMQQAGDLSGSSSEYF